MTYFQCKEEVSFPIDYCEFKGTSLLLPPQMKNLLMIWKWIAETLPSKRWTPLEKCSATHLKVLLTDLKN